VSSAAPACCTSADCTSGPTGTLGACNANVCSYPCNTPTYKVCGSACIPSGGCCAASDCAGVCQTCTNNVCAAVKSADDSDSCSGTCDASGACKAKQGQSCQLATTTGCIAGSTCAPDGYCCNQACTASCLACDVPGALGLCTPVASGAPHGNRTSCGSGTCGGSCSSHADGSCAYPTGSCGSPVCSGTNLVDYGTCSVGACVSPAPKACNNGLVCSANACKTSCGGDGDCVPSDFCESTACHRDAVQVSAGYDQTCVALTDGSSWCWGGNFNGELGDGSTASSTTPQQVIGLTGVTVTALAASNDFTCALTSAGQVRCWGHNYFGQLGNGATNLPDGDYTSPQPAVALGGTAIAVSAGYGHACAILSGGTVKCWGDDSSDELSGPINTSADSTASPVTATLAGGALAAHISAGDFHTCVVTTAGRVQCWGSNGNGECGVDPSVANTVGTPTDVGLSGVSAVSSSTASTCALIGTSVECWGAGSYMPSPVSGLGQATAIAAGPNEYGCAITGGSVQCWTGSGGSLALTTIAGVSAPTTLSVSSAYGGLSCATVSRGTTFCWTGVGAASEVAPSW